MINPFKEVNCNPDRQEKRKFAWSLIVGFPILASVWLLIGKISTGQWPLQLAATIAGAGFLVGIILWIVPAIARPVYLVWYGIACVIGLVISNTLLIGFYLTVITLFGLFRRSLGRQPLRKTFDKGASSYWIDAEKVTDPKRYFSQF